MKVVRSFKKNMQILLFTVTKVFFLARNTYFQFAYLQVPDPLLAGRPGTKDEPVGDGDTGRGGAGTWPPVPGGPSGT